MIEKAVFPDFHLCFWFDRQMKVASPRDALSEHHCIPIDQLEPYFFDGSSNVEQDLVYQHVFSLCPVLFSPFDRRSALFDRSHRIFRT